MMALPLLLALSLSAAKPNIVFILADDLGWNDVSLHGSQQIGTPKIDGFCKEGTVLGRYYVQSVCSPTRATLLTGRHVIHTGVYYPLDRGSAEGLNTSFKLLPQYLQDVGYTTHMVGKWHLGQNTVASLPSSRGFSTYLGYWSGAEDYVTHQTVGAYDFANGTETAFEYAGRHSAYTFTEQAVSVMREYGRDPEKPFFLYLAYQNVHWPLEPPQEYLDMYQDVPNPERRGVCALARLLDDAVGNVTTAVDQLGLTNNTIVVFSSDNGGPTNEYENTWSSNYPLRGGKNGVWEGSVRSVGCVRGPGVKVGWWDGLVHVSDWVPSLLDAAGGVPPSDFTPGDGISIWQALTTHAPSPRTWILYEAHPDNTTQHGNAYLSNDLKIIQVGSVNPPEEDTWPPAPGEDPSATPYTVRCPYPPPTTPPPCGTHYCLFNLSVDPCEHVDISLQHPEVVAGLLRELEVYKQSAVPPIVPVGCKPIVNSQGAWRPCDDP
eukprot:TRINITY_DN6511_c0_g1_i1.p1 TRINITY_DN6511_c0_g1~~TRINITY_DN6511_c0_g1_i1.p1  ORF type:complete len:490 (+),score=73.82 TRINITY_DN6511_c0_g1_i1:38-1507(+)